MPRQIITGDSLAVGVYGDDIYSRLGSDYDDADRQSGRSAADQLEYMQSKGASYYEGAEVVLSTGLLNSQGDFESVRAQFEFLINAGAKYIDVIGIPDTTPQYKVWGYELWKLTQEYPEVTYMGSFTAGSDGVHPEPGDYKRIYEDRLDDIENGVSFEPDYPYSTGIVNRLYNPDTNKYLFTTNEAEIDILTGYGWANEGAAFGAPEDGGTADVFRFYVESEGRHFYTANEFERDTIINNAAFSAWTYEGVAFSAYSVNDKPNGSIAVVRYLNEDTGGHIYSSNEYEQGLLDDSPLWKNEGVAWYSDPASKYLGTSIESQYDLYLGNPIFEPNMGPVV